MLWNILRFWKNNWIMISFQSQPLNLPCFLIDFVFKQIRVVQEIRWLKQIDFISWHEFTVSSFKLISCLSLTLSVEDFQALLGDQRLNFISTLVLIEMSKLAYRGVFLGILKVFIICILLLIYDADSMRSNYSALLLRPISFDIVLLLK